MNTIYFVAKIYYNDINYTKLVGLYNNINDCCNNILLELYKINYINILFNIENNINDNIYNTYIIKLFNNNSNIILFDGGSIRSLEIKSV